MVEKINFLLLLLVKSRVDIHYLFSVEWSPLTVGVGASVGLGLGVGAGLGLEVGAPVGAFDAVATETIHSKIKRHRVEKREKCDNLALRRCGALIVVQYLCSAK